MAYRAYVYAIVCVFVKYPLGILFLGVMSVIYSVTLAKFCRDNSTDECEVVFFSVRKEYCQHCGGSLIPFFMLFREAGRNR